MSAAIVLSSSPTRIFARSSTAADSSPSLPSPSQLFRVDYENRSQFQPSSKLRDGFSHGFKQASSLLGVRKSAENVPFRSPDQVKFKRHVAEASPRSPRFVLEQNSSPPNRATQEKQPQASQDKGQEKQKCVEMDTGILSVIAEPVKALPRRMDWTPPKELALGASGRDVPQEGSFSNGLMRSFTYAEHEVKDLPSHQSAPVTGNATSRQKVDLVNGILIDSRVKVKKNPTKGNVATSVSKRVKSPAKKVMTITSVATSHYFGHPDAQDESPMMQYLSMTQARTRDDDQSEVAVDCNMKAGKRKTNAAKSTSRPMRPNVTSPKTAIKALDAQEAIFGSASQLMGGELAVLCQHTDPALTQTTQPISIESTTPKSGRGTSKYARTRNLWSVSARDEDNALLYADTINLVDSPEVKGAFVGKELLLHDPAAGAYRSHAQKEDGSEVDVDPVDNVFLASRPPTFQMPSSRGLHTLSRTNSPRKFHVDCSHNQPEEGLGKAVVKPHRLDDEKADDAIKISLQEMDMRSLRSQMSVYGLKADMRKRANMIEALEKHWRETRGAATETTPGAATESVLKHGDFLSNLHDVLSRPQPKVKKPRKRKKDQAGDETLLKVTKRQRKAKERDETKSEPKKRGRRKKMDTIVTSGANVIDSDKVVEPTPMRETNEAGSRNESDAKVESWSKPVTATEASSASSASSSDESMGDKIQAAILRESETSTGSDRDHVKNPTWHEKMLMYDPIILEDLAAWLNTKGLALVDEDGEVSALEVREWCESNGICCLWRGGWRGQKTKGAED